MRKKKGRGGGFFPPPPRLLDNAICYNRYIFICRQAAYFYNIIRYFFIDI